MAYADQKMSSNRLIALIVVAILHVALGYGLVTGLAYEGVKKALKRVTTVDIEEEVKKEEPPPPPKKVESIAAAGCPAGEDQRFDRSAEDRDRRRGSAASADRACSPRTGTAAAQGPEQFRAAQGQSGIVGHDQRLSVAGPARGALGHDRFPRYRGCRRSRDRLSGHFVERPCRSRSGDLRERDPARPFQACDAGRSGLFRVPIPTVFAGSFRNSFLFERTAR